MRKLLLLVIVAAMCVPCYGGILVYKTSTSATVFTGDVKEVQKDRGYLVLDVDFDTQTVNSAQQVTYGDAEQETTVVSVEFSTPTGFIVADYSGNDKDAILFGKATLTDIGLSGDETVAKSLKGSMLVGLGTADLGTGTYSAKLDTKMTKAANGVEDTIAEVVADIVASLEDKYEPITDSTPPDPTPMTWASEPNATGDTTITMTASTATDAATGPVEYRFTNTTIAGHNSDWQSGTTFIDTGLTPDTNYTYTVKARDSAAVPNETADSEARSATTLRTADTNAPEPNRMEWDVNGEPNGISATEITMTAALATDAQGINGYYFTCVNDGNFDSGWKSATTDSTNWTASTRTFIASGLNPVTSYIFTVKARDNSSSLNETEDSNQASATTLADATAPTPDPMTWATVPEANGATSIYMAATTATDDTNSATVEYSFEIVIGAANGGTSSGWISTAYYQDSGLDANTEFAYRVQARDASGNMTGFSSIETATTGLTIQMMIDNAVAARTADEPITVTVPTGTYTENLDFNEPNITLESASGNTTIQLVAEANGISINDTGCTVGGSSGHGFSILGASATTVALIDAGQDDTVISYCDLNTAGNATMGIRVDEANGVTIANNNFFDDGSGVYLGGGLVENISITDNTFTKTTDSNFVNIAISDANWVTISGNTADHGMAIQVGPNDTNMINLTISGNTFTLGGILLYEPSADACDANRLRDVNIIGNTFSAGSQNVALRIDDLDPNDVQWTSLLFTGNSILRTPGFGTYNVWNVSGSTRATLLAERNYWGADDGPTGAGCGTTGASVSTFVDFNPYWTTPTGTDANCP